MASALIRIDQAANPQPAGVAGRARNDLLLGQPVTLRNGDDTDVNRHIWTMLDVPIGSSATLSSTSAPVVTFVPDVEGSYRVQLVVNDGVSGERDIRIAAVEDALGLRYAATGERAPEANWLVGGSPNEDGWGKDTEEILRLTGTLGGGLSAVLAAGNATGGSDILISNADSIVGQDGGLIFFEPVTGFVHVNSVLQVSTAVYTPAITALNGAGAAAGTSIIIVPGQGGPTDGDGGTLTLRSGAPQGTGTPGDIDLAGESALSGNTPGGSISCVGGDSDGTAQGGTLSFTSGGAMGTGDAGGISFTSGAVTTGDICVVQITNTCLEIAESTTTPGPPITAGWGRFSVSDDAPTLPRFQDDVGSEYYLHFADAYHRVLNSGSTGSTNTTIIRWNSIAESAGADITYTDSATDGGYWTINTAGIYTISTSARIDSACNLVINVDSALSNTPITSAATRALEAVDVASSPTSLSWSGFIPATYVIWNAITAGTPVNTIGWNHCSIARLK